MFKERAKFAMLSVLRYNDAEYNKTLEDNLARMNVTRPAPLQWTLFCMGFLVLCTFGGARQSPGRFTDPEYHYSFTIPAGWTQKSDQARPLVAFLGPVEQDFRVNISVYSEPTGGLTLPQFLKASKANLLKTKGLQLHGESKTTLGGAPAMLLQSSLKLNDQPPVENRQVVCTHNKRGFVITFTALPSNARTYLPVFTRMLKSFRW